jgi:pyruvate/2-oxoglutarate dehydrogenase complex dihydrolipoamide dehydrogenase (E3) component
MNWPSDKPIKPEDERLRPQNYQNPTPQGRYNLVILGAGTAGLATAIAAASLGAKVALVEKHLIGGVSLNAGDVPSSALIRAAQAASDMRKASEHGIRPQGKWDVDFPAVMERMSNIRIKIASLHSVSHLIERGIDVYHGEGRFVDKTHIEVNGQVLQFSRAVIATGSHTAIPDIPGLANADALTNETLFNLTELPRRLAVIGAGATGCEMAQAFARLGSAVSVFDVRSTILPHEDPQAAEIVRQNMERDGVKFHLGCKDMRIVTSGAEKIIQVDVGSDTVSERFDQILVATGREPKIEGLHLEAVKVWYDEQGVIVNDLLRTTNRRIYAAGDVCSPFKYTHVADAHSRIVISNALFFGSHRASALHIPWCTNTDPQIAGIGIRPEDHHRAKLKTLTASFSELDRAILNGEENGLLKLYYDHKGYIRGASIVSSHAGEIIGQITMAMNLKLKMSQLSSILQPYPSLSQILQQASDTYRRSLLTPFVAGSLKKILKWRR